VSSAPLSGRQRRRLFRSSSPFCAAPAPFFDVDDGVNNRASTRGSATTAALTLRRATRHRPPPPCNFSHPASPYVVRTYFSRDACRLMRASGEAATAAAPPAPSRRYDAARVYLVMSPLACRQPPAACRQPPAASGRSQPYFSLGSAASPAVIARANEGRIEI